MVYDKWEDVPQDPNDLNAGDEVHAEGRVWEWDTEKWVLSGESKIGNTSYEGVTPIDVETTTTTGTDFQVTTSFDMSNLPRVDG